MSQKIMRIERVESLRRAGFTDREARRIERAEQAVHSAVRRVLFAAAYPGDPYAEFEAAAAALRATLDAARARLWQRALEVQS